MQIKFKINSTKDIDMEVIFMLLLANKSEQNTYHSIFTLHIIPGETIQQMY